MNHEALIKEIAAAKPEFHAHEPLHVYIDEAAGVARFTGKHWDATRDQPGLGSVAGHKSRDYVISSHTAEEITWLAARAHEANTAMLLAQAPHVSRDDLTRALTLVHELDHVLEFHFDDGKEDANDVALAAVEKAHHHDASVASLASALEDYTALAAPHRKAIDGLGGFDAAVLDEAPKLVAKLRARESHPKDSVAVAAHAERDRTLNVLALRIAAVRGAARFVFRNHPDVRREATSGYERARRLEAKRSAAAASTAAAAGAKAKPA